MKSIVRCIWSLLFCCFSIISIIAQGNIESLLKGDCKHAFYLARDYARLAEDVFSKDKKITNYSFRLYKSTKLYKDAISVYHSILNADCDLKVYDFKDINYQLAECYLLIKDYKAAKYHLSEFEKIIEELKDYYYYDRQYFRLYGDIQDKVDRRRPRDKSINHAMCGTFPINAPRYFQDHIVKCNVFYQNMDYKRLLHYLRNIPFRFLAEDNDNQKYYNVLNEFFVRSLKGLYGKNQALSLIHDLQILDDEVDLLYYIEDPFMDYRKKRYEVKIGIFKYLIVRDEELEIEQLRKEVLTDFKKTQSYRELF